MYLLCTLTESLFGSPPFASKTIEELEEKLLDTKPIEVSYSCFLFICKFLVLPPQDSKGNATLLWDSHIRSGMSAMINGVDRCTTN